MSRVRSPISPTFFILFILFFCFVFLPFSDNLRKQRRSGTSKIKISPFIFTPRYLTSFNYYAIRLYKVTNKAYWIITIQIAEYFMGTWGGGNPKPFKYTEIQRMRYQFVFNVVNHCKNYFILFFNKFCTYLFALKNILYCSFSSFKRASFLKIKAHFILS